MKKQNLKKTTNQHQKKRRDISVYYCSLLDFLLKFHLIEKMSHFWLLFHVSLASNFEDLYPNQLNPEILASLKALAIEQIALRAIFIIWPSKQFFKPEALKQPKFQDSTGLGISEDRVEKLNAKDGKNGYFNKQMKFCKKSIIYQEICSKRFYFSIKANFRRKSILDFSLSYLNSKLFSYA